MIFRLTSKASGVNCSWYKAKLTSRIVFKYISTNELHALDSPRKLNKSFNVRCGKTNSNKTSSHGIRTNGFA